MFHIVFDIHASKLNIKIIKRTIRHQKGFKKFDTPEIYEKYNLFVGFKIYLIQEIELV